MGKILQVNKFIEKNPNPSLDTLFVHFKFDLESIIIACIKTNIPVDQILPNYNAPYTVSEIQDKIDQYQETPYLPFLLRKNLFTALTVFDQNLTELANSIILECSKENDYIAQIRQAEIFKNGEFLLKFSNILINSSLLDSIEKAILQKEEICVADEDQVFYDLLKLNKFISHREDSKKAIQEIVKDKCEETETSSDFLFFAKLNEDSNKIDFFQNYESLSRVISKELEIVSGKSIANTVKKKLAELVTGESKDMLSKLPFEASIIGDIAELKAKGLLFGLELIIEVYKDFPSTSAIAHRRSFEESGKKDVKQWFSDSITLMFDHFKQKNKLDLIEISPETINTEYLRFISKYYGTWEVLKQDYLPYADSSLDNDTLAFLSVTEFFLNKSIKISNYSKFI